MSFITPSKRFIHNSLVILSFLAASYALCQPLLQDLHLSGRDDWDFFCFLHEVSSLSLYEYGQFPLWNPYCGGGMPLIGNPQAGFLSPILLLTSLFGVVAGLKISVWLHTFLGLWGMWLLSGHCGVKNLARLAPPFIFMFSSAWAMHMVAGQIVWLSAAFLPFFFMAFLKGRDNYGWLLLAAVFESLMFYEGGTYVLGFSLLFVGIYTISDSLGRKNPKMIISFIAMNVLAAALSAPRLLPVLDLLGSHPRSTQGETPISWYNNINFTVDRFTVFDCDTVDFDSYFGIAVVLIYILSLSLYKKHRALVISSVFMFLIFLGNFGKFSPWNVVHSLPLFGNFYRGPTRSLIVFGFGVALLVGLYLGTVTSSVRRRNGLIACLVFLWFAEFSPWKIPLNGNTFFGGFQHLTLPMVMFFASLLLLIVLHLSLEGNLADMQGQLLVGVVVVLIGTDMLMVSSRVFSESTKPSNVFSSNFFPSTGIKLPRNFSPQLYHISPAQVTGLNRAVPSTHRPFSQIRIPGLYRNFHGAWSNQYLPLLQNKGAVDAYETIPIKRFARAASDRDYLGEHYFLNRGVLTLLKWSPNKYTYHVKLQAKDRLVVNQNYWPGWRTSQGVLAPYEGLLSVDLPPGEYDVELSYLPDSFLMGIGVFFTAAFSIVAFLMGMRLNLTFLGRSSTSVASTPGS